MFLCQNLEHEGSPIVGFCLSADCQEPKSQFCIECLINPQKHLNCRNYCKRFDKIDILLDLIIYKIDQMLEQIDQRFEQAKIQYQKTIKQIQKEQHMFQEIIQNLKEQKFKQFCDNVNNIKNWNKIIKSTQFDKEIIDLWLKEVLNLQQQTRRTTNVLQENLRKFQKKTKIIYQQSFINVLLNKNEVQQYLDKTFKSFETLNNLYVEYPNFQDSARIVVEDKMRCKSSDLAVIILQNYFLSRQDRNNTLSIDQKDENFLITCDEILRLDKNSVYALGMKCINRKNKQLYLYRENKKGLLIMKQKQFEQALTCFDKAIQLDPNFGFAYNAKGHTLFEIEQFLQQYLLWNNMNKLQFALIKQLNLIQMIFMLILKKVALSLLNIREHIIRNRIIFTIINNLKQYEQAIICYDKVIQIDQNFFYAYNEKGDTLIQIEQFLPSQTI